MKNRYAARRPYPQNLPHRLPPMCFSRPLLLLILVTSWPAMQDVFAQGVMSPQRPVEPARRYGFAGQPAQPQRLPATTGSPPIESVEPPRVVRRAPSITNSQPLTLHQAVMWSLLHDRLIRTLDDSVNIQNLTTLDADIAAQQILGAAAQFDPKISSRVLGGKIDQPPDAFFGPGIVTNSRRDEVEFALRLEKLWSTGAVTSLGYEPPLAYLFFPSGVTSGFNPIHTSDLVLRVRQPLLRGVGPATNLAKFRIAEQQTGQAALLVNSGVQAQIRSVQEAYWRLHAARVALEAVEFAIPLAEKNVQIEQSRLNAERVTYSEVARASVKLEELLQQRIAAMYKVRQRDYQLRQLVGIPVNQQDILMPSDSPVCEPPSLRYEEFVNMALARRPDLQRRRLEVGIRQNSLLVAQNSRLPELDAQGLYRTSGISNEFSRSMTQMGSFDFADWNLGLTFSVPIGNRSAISQVRAAELSAAREAAILRGFEQQVGFEIADRMAHVEADYARFERAMQQVKHAQQWLNLARIRYEQPPVQRRGQDSLLLALFDYQTAIQAYVEALTAAANSLADYNSGLARLEESRGSVLDRWGILPGQNFEMPAPAPQPSPPPNAGPMPAVAPPWANNNAPPPPQPQTRTPFEAPSVIQSARTPPPVAAPVNRAAPRSERPSMSEGVFDRPSTLAR